MATLALGASAAGAVQYPPDSPSASVSASTVSAGGSTTVSGTGWQPNSTVSCTLSPGSVSLGSATVDGNGAFSKTVTIPTGTSAGEYTIVGEHVALESARDQRLPAIVVRFFNTVGPRQSPAYGMVIPRFVRQARDDRPITVHGDGSQQRCFCHVADTVRALIGLIDCPAAVGEVINIGSQEEVSIEELALRVAAQAGSTAGLEHISHREVYGEGFEDIDRRVPDISKIKRLIGWEPQRDLNMILAEAMNEASGRAPSAPLDSVG